MAAHLEWSSERHASQHRRERKRGRDANERARPSEAALKASTHVNFKYHPPTQLFPTARLPVPVFRKGSGLNAVVIDYVIMLA